MFQKTLKLVSLVLIVMLTFSMIASPLHAASDQAGIKTSVWIGVAVGLIAGSSFASGNLGLNLAWGAIGGLIGYYLF